MRLHLVGDAIHLALLLGSTPATTRPRVHALTALMFFGASRLAARTDDLGDLIRLEDQNRALWNPTHLARAFQHLDRSAQGGEISRFHLEAGIASLHASAHDKGSADWPQILSLYDELIARFPSPIVALNRAVAVLHVCGPEEAERALSEAQADPSLHAYALVHSVAAEFARAKGDVAKAVRLLDRALGCPSSEPQGRFLQRRRDQIFQGSAERGIRSGLGF